MWRSQDEDPGGSHEPPQTSQQLTDLKDQNEQQQVLIAQLKEMLRKSEQTNVTQENVEEYVQTLSKAKAKRTKQKKDETKAPVNTNIDSNKKEKINLLRQQLEENKAKFAERGKSQKDFEDKVSQLRAQFNDSQHLINASSLNISLNDSKITEYSTASSQEELHDILLKKDKYINELSNKLQKLEGHVLDLQENLKEKDSVLDARTKAITLMTESLSKKSKVSLDSLEETKEQMRKMQEHFVQLEGDMKARQLKLLDDLKAKNLEIADMHDENLQLRKEIDGYKSVDTPDAPNLQTLLDEQKAENSECLEKIKLLQQKLTDNTETNELQIQIDKLKKQLDESNKSMIKAKAQHKNKVKELNKKIDVLKKTGDANVFIEELQAENSKLSEKIAVLEEEKGNIQLNIVESESNETAKTEHLEKLENLIKTHNESMEEKDKVILILEEELRRAKQDLGTLNEKLETLSDIKNTQVTTEMNSIQFEEQIDKLENEKKLLIDKTEALVKENESLLEKIDNVTKQKQDLSNKLDSYIQENMELIDKLEKLSAEKVSSAESIEIVEGLTQQEKLELAAYQKNMDISGEHMKEEITEPPAELNESVLQLSEDSTELLQRIDMFNVERREVMGKLEELREENNLLSLKLKEIENNRDVLAEAYEHLQNEKEKLEDDVLKLQTGDKNDELNNQLNHLEKQYSTLLEENSVLQSRLKENDSIIKEKDSAITEQIKQLQETISNNVEEIANYKKIIEENKTELISSATVINSLHATISAKETEIDDLNNMIENLNVVIDRLEMENNYEKLEKELDSLKTALDEQIQQSLKYESELERNTTTIEHLNKEIGEMNKKLLDTEHELECKENELRTLSHDFTDKQSIIENLQASIKDKDQKFHQLKQELGKQCEKLQKKVSGNSDQLDKKVEELSTKNKEQMEKMRKIAANLKKKSQAYQELEQKYSTEKEKWENEVQEKNSIIDKSDEKLKSQEQQLKELEVCINLKNDQVSRAEEELAGLKQQIRELESTNIGLQKTIESLQGKKTRGGEINLQQELSGSIHEDFDCTEVSEIDSVQTKVRELEMLIETKEIDLTHYKDRTSQLEETVAYLEEQRLLLERKKIELEENISTITATFEEKLQIYKEMEQKFDFISKEQENLFKWNDTLKTENQELSDTKYQLTDLNEKLKTKAQIAQDKVNELLIVQSNLEELENINNNLKKQISILEANLKFVQNENEELLKQSKLDIEKMENDFQLQMESLSKAKNELTVRCEKLQELVDAKEELQVEENNFKTFELTYQDQIQKLTEELNTASTLLNTTREENAVLNNQIVNLQEKLLLNAKSQDSQETVFVKVDDNVAQENMPTFHWPENPTNDAAQWFETASEKPADLNAVSEQNPPISITENTTEELLKKIQALQFMLYNVETDKNDALLQCHEMSNELTRLVYERENAYTRQDSLDILKDVVSEADIAATTQKDLQDLEYTKTNQNQGETTETVIEPKVAYLCYNPEVESQILSDSETKNVNKKELQSLEYSGINLTGVEEPAVAKSAYLCYNPEEASPGIYFNPEVDSQILSDSETKNVNKKELQSLEYSGINLTGVEEPAVAKSAYLCYKPEEAASGPLAFVENDDGWGWGPEEGKQEEEFLQKTAQASTQSVVLQQKIENLNEQLRNLQAERETHIEEVKQLQLKSGKLIKKCKELKQKNDKLISGAKKDDSSGLLNLYDAIQEELKSQVIQLEKNIKEISNELDKERGEKSSLQKKAEILTAANERISELEEKQRLEVVNWQRKYQDVLDKLQKQDWGDEFPVSEQTSPLQSDENKQKIDELNQTIKELSLDNEELQTLLDEQRIKLIELEKVTKNTKSGTDSVKLLDDNKKLQENLLAGEETINQLTHSISTLEQQVKEKDLVIAGLQSEITALKTAEIALDEFGVLQKELHAALNEKEAILLQLNETSNQLRLAKIENEQKGDEVNETMQHKVDTLQEENYNMVQQLNEAQQRILLLEKQLEDLNIESDRNKLAYDENLVELNKNTVRIQELTQELQSKDEAFELRLSETLKEYTTTWQLQVDQRGMDIAESWKLHLETVEADFASVQTKLQQEITELEEKCNALVNENNELRKNVDAEIRQEVDRISTMQQQANENQQVITELRKALEQKLVDLDTMQHRVEQNEMQIVQLQGELQDKNSKLANVDLIIDTTQKQFDEKREVVEEIVKILEKNTSWPVSYEKELVISEFERQLGLINEKEKEIVELQQRIVQFQAQIEAKQQEFLITNDSLEEYRKQVDKYDQRCIQLEEELQQKAIEISNLTEQLHKVEANKDINNGNISQLQEEIIQSKQAYYELQQSLAESQQQLCNINEYYTAKCNELDNISSQLQIYHQQIQESNEENNNLKAEIQQKEYSYNSCMEQIQESNEENNILKAEIQQREYSYNSCMERLTQMENDYKEIQQALASEKEKSVDDGAKTQDLIKLQNELDERKSYCTALENNLKIQSDQLNDLKTIIEDQVMKIEGLKKSLFEKSNDLDSFIAEVDISKPTIPQPPQPLPVSDANIASDRDEDEFVEPVSRPEYDLALYLLHQSDVRCEELTVELTQLLEERDTLQLRLSNAIREQEDIKRKFTVDEHHTGDVVTEVMSQEGHSSDSLPEQNAGASGKTNSENLASKLSELKTIQYKKDKTFVDGQEFRRLQQLSIMQHHMNEASKLPPEAAAKLVDASYTLSRDVQSPSKVLLNWLWGRSTPKQNDT